MFPVFYFLLGTSDFGLQNKPTGQGISPGVSLAYDIISAQGGETSIGSCEKVSSTEGKANEFLMTLIAN